jgi:carbon monoxide dehydrogenase subunit G
MAGFSATEWIAASSEVVFAFMQDVQHFPEVITSVVRAEKLTDGPVGLGTRFRETRKVNGREVSAEIEVTTYEPPRRYSATSTQSGITATYHYTLTPEAGGTRIDLQADVSASGLKKLLLPVVVRFMKKEDEDHLQQLKAAVERSTAKDLAS